jgi:hypothetical protein
LSTQELFYRRKERLGKAYGIRDVSDFPINLMDFRSHSGATLFFAGEQFRKPFVSPSVVYLFVKGFGANVESRKSNAGS